LKLPLISINGTHVNDKIFNISFITNSILPTKGVESVLNTEVFSKQTKNKRITFNEYVNLNSIGSELSNINHNYLPANNTPYDNHIIYEDDYLHEKSKPKRLNRNVKNSLSYENNFNFYPLSKNNLKNSNLILNKKPYFNKNLEYIKDSSIISPQIIRFQTPKKNKDKTEFLNNIERNIFGFSEKTNKILPKLFNQNYFHHKSKSILE